MQQALFGAGCFWGVEVAFRNVPGVTDVSVGYAGGHVPAPTYEQVCSGQTGHAEVVRVTFDPEQVPFEELLDVFFSVHDPTQVDRQGPDVGAQYRSVVIAADDSQREAAERKIRSLEQQGVYDRPIATEVAGSAPFFAAEDYHQQYLVKRGLATCRI